MNSNSVKKNLLGYIFIIPSITLILAFYYYPIINGMIFSMTDWNGFAKEYNFIGLKNYIELFTSNRYFWDAMVVNLKFAIISTIIQTVLGFLLAYMLMVVSKRWQSFYKVALYLPVLLPGATVGVMWTFIYNPSSGLINQFLGTIGLESLQRGWVKEASTALGCVIATNTWRFVGITMVLYFITMITISPEIIESVKIDGGNQFHILRYVYLPLTWFATEINFLLSIIGGMKTFDMFFLLTGGGPGRATEVTSLLIYRTAFDNYEFSKALTMTVILFIVILLLTAVSKRALKRDEI